MNSSKRNTIIAIALVVFIAAGIYFLVNKKSTTTSIEPFFQQEKVLSEEYAFEFTYESGDEGLALFEPEVSGEPLKAAYILMLTPDFVQVRNAGTNAAGETPPTISMFVFTKPDYKPIAQPRAVDGETSTPGTQEPPLSRLDEVRKWAEQNQELTGYASATTEAKETEIDGVKAITYETEGLYNQEVYIASYQKNIYLFLGQFDSKDDPIYEKYQQVLERISFQ